MISPHTGRVIHHNNCTYCLLKVDKNIGTKKKKVVQERCILHNKKLLPPFSDGKRTCEDYIQVGCMCEACEEKRERFDVETLLAKKDKAW